jgi:hypothetical protein
MSNLTNRNKEPRRLKKLENADLVTLKNELDNVYVVTKQETAKVIRDYVVNEIGNLPYEISNKRKDELSKLVDDKMSEIEKIILNKMSSIEKELAAFIDHKFDSLAEKACDMLLNRKFLDEVNKRAEELLLKKEMKGKF